MKPVCRTFRKSRRSTISAALIVVTVTLSLWPVTVSSAAILHLDYTALGDSLAFGAFALPGRGYVPRYAGFLQNDLSLPVALYPLGVPGWTSSQLVDVLRGSFFYRLFVFYSEVVTWNIGGNDLNAARSRYKSRTCGGADNQQCLRDAVETFKVNWNGIIAEIFKLRHGRPTIIRTMDIYNPFVNEDRAADTWIGDAGNDFVVLKPYLDEVNAHIAFTAAEYKFGSAPVYRSFNGPNGDEDPADKGLLAFDGIHPNTAGHALIAHLLRNLGYALTAP